MFFERDPDYFVHALRYGDPYFAAYLKQSGASIILDRSFPSEWVYSRALERHTDHDMLRMVDTMYAELGTKIVLARRSSYEGIIDDEFRVLDSKMLQRVDELYAEFSEWTSCQTLTLLVDDEDLEREIEAVTLFTLGPKEERNACKGQ
jgi:thymidylate kinase